MTPSLSVGGRMSDLVRVPAASPLLLTMLPPIQSQQRTTGDLQRSVGPTTKGDVSTTVEDASRRRTELASRSTTVVARRGSRQMLSEADLAGFEMLSRDRAALGALPKRSSVITSPSPLPHGRDNAPSSSSLKPGPHTSTQRLSHGHHKLGHPLQEERPTLDVWPAKATTRQSTTLAPPATLTQIAGVLSRPEALDSITRYIGEALTALHHEYPDVDAADDVTLRVNEDNDEDDLMEEAVIVAARRSIKHQRNAAKAAARYLVSLKTGGRSPSAAEAKDAFGDPCSREDAYRIARIRLFTEALREFARQFTVYRPLLRRILYELESFALYSHRNVWSPEARETFMQQARADAAQALEKDRLVFEQERASLQQSLSEKTEALVKLQSAQMTFRFQLDERDKVIAAKDKEIAENAEGRTSLLNRITRLEKELWKVRLTLEEPEQRIQQLQRTNKELEARLAKAQTVFDEFNREKALLKDRCERLEEQLRQLKARSQSTNMSSLARLEIVAHKKRELELLELNARLQSKCALLEQRLKDASHSAPSNVVTTPRPLWGDYSDVCSTTAPSTMKRVQELVGAYRQLRDAASERDAELAKLKTLLGTAYRDDIAFFGPQLSLGNAAALQSIFLTSDEVIPQMRARWFPKLGFDSWVPGYLKGVGRAKNLYLGRDQVSTLVRHLWMERQNVRPGTPWDVFLAKFLADRCPSGEAVDSFIYSVHYSLGWFSYDPFIGFTRNLILGGVDETVFLDMQLGIAALREELSRAAVRKTSDLDLDPLRSSAAATGNASANGPSPAAAVVDVPKSVVAATLVEVSACKPDAMVKALMIAAARDCPGRTVDLDVVFNFDVERGRFSNFLEEYYRQYLVLRRTYLGELVDALYRIEVDDDGLLSPPPVARAILSWDPHVPVQFLDEWVARLFSVSVEKLFPAVDAFSDQWTVGLDGERIYGCQDTVTAETTEVIAKLQLGVIRRFTATETALETGSRPAVAPRKKSAVSALPDETLPRTPSGPPDELLDDATEDVAITSV